MRRRDFIGLVGSAALPWPLAARAQDGMPVIGFMHTASLDRFAYLVAAFRKGLAEEGYVEGRNVAMEYRWAEGHYDRLPKLASELVARHVNVLAATGGDESGLAAKAATTTIPVVFQIGGNPIQLGLVARFNRPGGNLTGTTLLSIETAPKRLQLLHEIVPDATNVAVLVNPTDPGAETQSAQLKSAARTVGMRIKFFQAATDADIDSAFAGMAAQSAKALVVQADPFFTSRRDRLVGLANRNVIAAVYPFREFSASGGLISYGADISEVFRQTGIYVGRILKGDKPSDLPVQQPTKFDLAINLKTAKALGLSVPATLLATADEVIE
jgi:putative ABC transport system substrate-binding protein